MWRIGSLTRSGFDPQPLGDHEMRIQRIPSFYLRFKESSEISGRISVVEAKRVQANEQEQLKPGVSNFVDQQDAQRFWGADQMPRATAS